jgi:hypothetical protein
MKTYFIDLALASHPSIRVTASAYCGLILVSVSKNGCRIGPFNPDAPNTTP